MVPTLFREVILNALATARARFLEIQGSSEAQKELGIGAGGDVIRVLDLEVENAILRSLKEDIKDFVLISEESGIKRHGSGGLNVVVDPVDGSTNALRGYPACSSAIAIAEGDTLNSLVAAGVINLITGDVYYAEKGLGAFLNGLRIRPRNVSRVEDALIAFELNVRGQISGYVNKVAKIIENAKHVRLIGSDALEICFIASGASDAFIDLRGFLRVPDFAAAVLTLKEAGGIITNSDGREIECRLEPRSRSTIVAACTSELHSDILGRIAKS